MIEFFAGLSNVYILSTATVFLAVIIALYCANLTNYGDEKLLNATDKDSKQTEAMNESKDVAESDSDIELSEGLVSKLKSARLKELESSLTDDQREEERRVEREQLSAIFELLKRQEAELNMKEIDESELSAQMGLYR
ncbi:matrix-remodeling-associated protein 7 [Episyrphus balteatus]|uniref:matrix-remodeling-associated protein 7 n=1 Tax=Episyrphus balteatus TaxID=286459 RepID=UPI002486059A|nr:matrix-remodeling-associated protein 7 [Episyrphus balteatus]